MHGNVWQWVEDGFGAYTDSMSFLPDPVADSGSRRVVRGGSWGGNAEGLRCVYRYGFGPDVRSEIVGFRLVRQSQRKFE